MNSMQEILKKVLKKIKPKEKEIESSNKMFLEIEDFIREKFSVETGLMGSMAKDTFLAGDKDLDIFIFFDEKTGRETLEKKGLEIGKAVFSNFKSKDYQISYAEHPYTKGIINGFRVEIVPAYKVKRAELLKSAVDRTPFHKAYVLNNLKRPDDVRLLKKFLKSAGCYGSDLKTEGFSGYLCELLIIKYASFENALKASQEWHYQEVVDLNGHFSKHQHFRIRKRFENQPLIFLDPTDKNRNVAAVLSHKKLASFIYASRRFLKKPSLSHFFRPERKTDKSKILTRQKERGTALLIITFKKPEVIADILYPQLRRFSSGITKTMKSEGFVVLDFWEFADSECGIAIELLSKTLPKFMNVRGPSIFNPVTHQERFMSKYKKIWFEGTYLIAEAKRSHVDAEGFFFTHLKKNKKYLRDKGIPSSIAESVSRGFKITDASKASAIKSYEFWRGLEKETLK